MGPETLIISLGLNSIQSRSPISMTRRSPSANNFRPDGNYDDWSPHEAAENEINSLVSLIRPASPTKPTPGQTICTNHLSQQRFTRFLWNSILWAAIITMLILLMILSGSELLLIEDGMRLLPGKKRMDFLLQRPWVSLHMLGEDGRFHTVGRTLVSEQEAVHTGTTEALLHPSSLPRFYNNYQPCIEPLLKDPLVHRLTNKTNGYLVVTANGGLNQMRNGICDMVAIAMILNATLVVPQLDHNSFWEDTSEFGDIFDVNHFIKTLEQYVPIVESLPNDLETKDQILRAPVSWSKSSYYIDEILPILKEHGVVHFSHTDSRLANNDLPSIMQQLRCHACYTSLKYNSYIEDLATNLVHRMRQNGEQYIALHLRYEKDMLAFTGCSHGLNDIEAKELQEMRYNVQHWKEKEIDGEHRRIEGGCPLTPHEVALTLLALGFDSIHTQIYVVAGPLFGGDEALEPLQRHFPLLFTHTNLASKSEIAPLSPFASRLAALDYLVALHSDVFFHSFDGNMARALQGHRRFLGHLVTITPHRKGLVKLVDEFDNGTISWATFENKVKHLHRKRLGAPEWRHRGDSPKSEENFYANPYPGCICRQPQLFKL